MTTTKYLAVLGALVALALLGVAIDFGSWDTHRDNFNALKDKMLPPFDAGVAALLADLHGRCSPRRVSPAALAPDLYTEGGWAGAAAGNCRPGRQDQSAGNDAGRRREAGDV